MLKNKIKKIFKKIAVEWEWVIYTTGTPLIFTGVGSTPDESHRIPQTIPIASVFEAHYCAPCAHSARLPLLFFH